jgi:hypothetical protein
LSSVATLAVKNDISKFQYVPMLLKNALTTMPSLTKSLLNFVNHARNLELAGHGLQAAVFKIQS